MSATGVREGESEVIFILEAERYNNNKTIFHAILTPVDSQKKIVSIVKNFFSIPSQEPIRFMDAQEIPIPAYYSNLAVAGTAFIQRLPQNYSIVDLDYPGGPLEWAGFVRDLASVVDDGLIEELDGRVQKDPRVQDEIDILKGSHSDEGEMLSVHSSLSIFDQNSEPERHSYCLDRFINEPREESTWEGWTYSASNAINHMNKWRRYQTLDPLQEKESETTRNSQIEGPSHIQVLVPNDPSEAEAKHNSRMEGASQIQYMVPTDSGYVSTSQCKIDTIKNSFVPGHKQTNGESESKPLLDDIDVPATNESPGNNRNLHDLENEDIRTIYSNSPSISSFGHDKYLSELAEELFDKVAGRQLDRQLIDTISKVLPDLLKSFAIRIGHIAPSQMHRDIMFYVHKHRSEITSYFQQKYFNEKGENRADAQNEESDQISLYEGRSAWKIHLNNAEEVLDEMSIDEKIRLWERHHDDPEAVPNEKFLDMRTSLQKTHLGDPGQDSEKEIPPDAKEWMEGDTGGETWEKDEADEEDGKCRLRAYRDLIFRDPAYQWLLNNLRRELLLTPTEPDNIQAIRRQMTEFLKSPDKISRKLDVQAVKITFEVDWDPISFVREQGYRKHTHEVLGKVITLTGSANDAQAFTSAQYMRQTWPSAGHILLQLVEEVVHSGPVHRHTCELSDKTKLTAWIYDSSFLIEAFGTKASIIEVGEQVAWLGAALRSSPYELGIALCTPSINIDYSQTLIHGTLSGPEYHCKIYFAMQTENELSRPLNGRCWHSLFRNPVVVHGYPIARRSMPDIGLEIPLNIMAGLTGTKRIDTFKENFFIKGFSAMMVPKMAVQEKDDGDLLIWHLLQNDDGSHISYLDNTVPHAENISHFVLKNARHIVGWCPSAKYSAGAVDAKYPAKDITIRKPHQGCLLHNISITYGELITGDPYSIGKKDTTIHISRDRYIPKLKRMHDKSIVLWDEEDERGWIINGTSALLHLVRASLKYDSEDSFSSVFCFKQEDLQEAAVQHTFRSAISVLVNPKNKKLEIYPDEKGAICFEDRIEHFYDVLDKMITYQEIATRESHEIIRPRPRKYLEGWDFRDLAKLRDPVHSHVATLPAIGKGWVDFTRAIGAVTLFGRGFGEIIEPTNGTLCSHWAALPKNRYYLAASISDLENIMIVNEETSAAPMTRSGNIIWHNPGNIFQPCQCRKKSRDIHSDPVQVLLPSKFCKTLKMNPLPMKSKGAVIFGHNTMFNYFWKDSGDPEAGKPPSSSEDSEPDFHDSGIGSSSSPSAKFETPSLEQYKIGLVCALPKELKAVRALFDCEHGDLNIPVEDTNHYNLGQIEQHNVVAACLPLGEYGTNSAADVVSNMRRSFTSIKCYLLVGIGGGVPSNNDVRLGDVVVSKPTAIHSGVIQYDFGKAIQDSTFEPTGALQRPPRFLMTAISSLLADPDISLAPLQTYVTEIVTTLPEYTNPCSSNDILFTSESVHDPTRKTCAGCKGSRVKRQRRTSYHPQIHYGLIASGNKVVKDARIRDDLGMKHDILCIETEAAGVMNTVPCLVIRGICDYADSHKNDMWQEYASATAAAYVKLLLSVVRSQNDVGSNQPDSQPVKDTARALPSQLKEPPRQEPLSKKRKRA